MGYGKTSCSKVHPTCNLVNLRTGAKIVALMDMVFGIIGIIWFVVMLEKYGLVSLDPFENVDSDKVPSTFLGEIRPLKASNETLSPTLSSLSTNHKAISLALSSFYTSVNLVLFILLLVGAHTKNVGKCLIWYYIRCAILVFKFIIYGMYILSGRPLYSQIPFMIFMIGHTYGLWLVNSFVNEMRNERRQLKLQEMRNQRSSEQNEDERNGIEKAIEYRKGIENQHFVHE